MEEPLELPILIPYRPSVRVGAFNTVAHGGAVCCLLVAHLPPVVAGLLAAGVVAHYVYYLRRLLSPEQLCFRLDRDGRWQLLRGQNDAVDLILLPGALVHPHLIVLCFREKGGRHRSCVLTHDNLDAQTLRRLRVRLRWPRHG